MNDLQKRTELYIEEKRLLDLHSGFHVVTGVSGGADSVCLLLLLKGIARRHGGTVTAVHVNHNLRGPAADADQRFVEHLCETCGVELFIFSEDVRGYAKKRRLSEEEAGRELRYRRFSETARLFPDSKIAVAHHMDDQAETVLFHLIRGAGLRGFSGMQPETEWNEVPVIRPLLFAEREEIEGWLTVQGQIWCTDATNAETAYSRNRIRHGILREMKEINPGVVRHICRTAELAGTADAFLEAESEALFARCAEGSGSSCAAEQEVQMPCLTEAVSPAEQVSLQAELLQKANPLVAEHLIYRVITQLCGHAKDITHTHVKDVKQLAGMETGKRVNLPDGVLAVKENARLVLKRAGEDGGLQRAEPVVVPKDLDGKNQFSILLPEGTRVFLEITDLDARKRSEFVKKNLYTKAFDYDRITGSLFFGNRMAGDRITLGNGGKSVNRFLIDAKIPRDERDRIILLKDDREVLWIIGYRINENYKITDKTKTVLRVTVAP